MWMTHAKMAQNKFTFPRILHLSSNRRVCNLAFYFQFTTPARKLTHRMKFERVWITRILGTPRFFCTLGQRNTKNQTQKDTNLGNAMILSHFRPEKRQKSDPERHKFWECHNSSLPWARESPNPTAKDMNFAQNCTH